MVPATKADQIHQGVVSTRTPRSDVMDIYSARAAVFQDQPGQTDPIPHSNAADGFRAYDAARAYWLTCFFHVSGAGKFAIKRFPSMALLIRLRQASTISSHAGCSSVKGISWQG